MQAREPNIVLIYPPNQLMSIEIPRPDGSLGPLYLAGALRRANFKVNILDASVGDENDSLRETFFRQVMQTNGLVRIGMTPERIREHISNNNYNIVGIHSNFTPQTRMAIEIARLTKEVDPEILVIAGGVNARALYSRFLNSGFVDLVVLTEGEKIIVNIIRAWQNNNSFHRIGGIAYNFCNKIVINKTASDSFCSKLDDLPFPAWDLLPFGKYDEINSPHGSITPGKRRRYAPIMTSRGCPFRCAYCHISEEKTSDAPSGNIGLLRFKSIERVVAEVESLISLGVTHLYIEDDSLLAKKRGR